MPSKYVDIENPKNRNFIFLLYFSIWFLLLLGGYSKENAIIFYYSIVSLVCGLVLRAFLQKNVVFLILFSYFLLYVLALKYPFIYNIPISVYSDFVAPVYIYNSTLSLFLFFIVFFWKVKIKPRENIFQIGYLKNNCIFWINYLLALFSMLRGKMGENILTSGGYGRDAEVVRSSLMEYFLVFFVIAFIFSNNDKYKIRWLLLLSTFFCLKNLLYGGRIEVVMMLIALLILHYQFKFGFKFYLISFFVAMYFFYVVGNIRENPMVILSNDIGEVLIPFNDNAEIVTLVSQEGDVNYSSSRIIGLTSIGIIQFGDRVYALFLFFLSIILPHSMLPELANLSTFKIDEYPVGGGGLISAYFFVFSGYIGVFLIAFFLANVFNKYSIKKHPTFTGIYVLFVLITTPRWFAYYPIHIFKLALYGAIFFEVVKKIDMFLRYNKK